MSLTPEQLELRRSGLGASEVATLVGVGGGSLIELYESKVLPPRADDGDALARDLGTLLEDPVAAVYAKRTSSFLAYVSTIRHPSKPLALATPDRARFLTLDAERQATRGAFERNPPPSPDHHILLDREALEECERLVEVKTTAARNRRDYGAEGTGVIPEDKAIQVTWQLGVCGVACADMPVLFRGDFGVSIETFAVTFDQNLFDALYERAERWWAEHVIARKPPSPDGSDRYDDFLKRAYPAGGLPPIVASEADEALMLRFAKIREATARLEKAKKATRQELVSAIGNAEGMTSARFGSVSYRRTRDAQEVDWQKAASEAQNLAALCLTVLPEGEQRASLEAQLRAIVPSATSVRPGYRKLLPRWQGEAKLELARLELALDALTEGEP